MKFSWEHLVAIGAAVLVALLAWFSGPVFRLSGLNWAILGGGIVTIGATAIAAFLWWARSRRDGRSAMPSQMSNAPRIAGEAAAARVAFAGTSLNPNDIQLLIREAESKVASARLGHGAKLTALRTIFIVGEAGSGKTTALLHSGLDPELLAGQVHHEGAVIPTPAANFWFARKTVFVEAGANCLAEPRLWIQLVRRLSPRGAGSIFGKKKQAERAAIVCADCEALAASVASPNAFLEVARKLRTRLDEMSQALGSSFPVYVLFTGADRIAFFNDFVGTMTNDESAQVLGTTLPASATPVAGVYAERETRRLAAAFNSIFCSLADCRPSLLQRERVPEKQYGLYEFPRQFRKLGKPAVQFLVELFRPSQLRTGPFLRGFYFTGMRTVAPAESSPTVMATRTTILGSRVPELASNATSILRSEDMPAFARAESATQFPGAEARSISQWVFLSHIFDNVLLQDQSAFRVSGASTRVNVWRRAILVAATIVCLAWISGLLLSFFSNRSLETELLRAEQAVLIQRSSNNQSPSLETLQALDAVRKSVSKLSGYESNGVPLHLRWGLYAGQGIYPEARTMYFSRFSELLFGQTQSSMIAKLGGVPRTPGVTDDYSSVYDTLKAYLITTSDHDKSSADFITPVLLKNWPAGQNADESIRGLAQEQFNFYAGELEIQNPYSSNPDIPTRDRARNYLNQFGAFPKIYAAMLNDAAKHSQPVKFYNDHPDATEVIRSVPEIPGAFTKGGWDFMQKAIDNIDQYFHGEEWVLGPPSEASPNREDLLAQLKAKYQADYVKQWQSFLVNARGPTYSSPEDAARKLRTLANSTSPLLALLCVVSQNTSGRGPDIDKAFKPVEGLMPAGCESRYVTSVTTPYIGGLANLQFCFESLARATPDQREVQREQCDLVATDTKRIVANQIVPTMEFDPVAHLENTVRALFEAPLNAPSNTAQAVGGGVSPKELCDALARLQGKYPFSNSQEPEATFQDVSEFYRPGDGILDKFVQNNRSTLVLEGGHASLAPGANNKWNPTFLDVVNHALIVQKVLFPGGGAQIHYPFTVRATLPEGISSVVLTLDGQSFTYSSGQPNLAKEFVWPGSSTHEATISLIIGGVSQSTPPLTGPWAVFRFFGNSPWVEGGARYRVDWSVRGNSDQVMSINGVQEKVLFEVDTNGAAPIFSPHFMAAQGCPVHPTK